MEGARVLILTGTFRGNEGMCLGEESQNKWAISPSSSDEILSLTWRDEFALLIDLSAAPADN